MIWKILLEFAEIFVLEVRTFKLIWVSRFSVSMTEGLNDDRSLRFTESLNMSVSQAGLENLTMSESKKDQLKAAFLLYCHSNFVSIWFFFIESRFDGKKIKKRKNNRFSFEGSSNVDRGRTFSRHWRRFFGARRVDGSPGGSHFHRFDGRFAVFGSALVGDTSGVRIGSRDRRFDLD